ncbi:hypothetical protein LSTR_LSTR007922 [Laodelphax striatellus]|uniref:RING-type domain-containing protein n=1 Tax=Laodelphax striatellus TaxID=195883 RepID=A0A482XLZ3_LAOST|nr:hypothetical protein LSTR_LSTR007922 [Laodelphax striatellus]
MNRTNKKLDPAFDEFFRAMQAYFLHHMTQVKNELVDLINRNHEESKSFNGNEKYSVGASNFNEPCGDNNSSVPDKKLFTLCQSIKLGQNELNLMLQTGEESIDNVLTENRNLRETVNELNLRVQNLSEQLDATKASNEQNFLRYENSLKEYLKISVDSNIILRALVSDVMTMKYNIMLSKKTARDNGVFEEAQNPQNNVPLAFRLGNGAAAGPPGEYVRDLKDANAIAETIAETFRVDGPSTNKCAAFFRPKSISIQFHDEETLDEWLKAAKQRRELNERNIYQQLIELEEDNVVVNKKPFDCTICLTKVDRGEGITLKECLHMFCRDCLAQTIEYNEDAVVKCPYRGETENDVCNHNLLEREIREIIPRDLYEKHLARSLSLSESKIKNSFHCRTPDCCGWWVVEDEVTFINCPVCTAENCIRCRAIHPTMDCRRYQDELVILAEKDPDAQRTLRYFRQMKERVRR